MSSWLVMLVRGRIVKITRVHWLHTCAWLCIQRVWQFIIPSWVGSLWWPLQLLRLTEITFAADCWFTQVEKQLSHSHLARINYHLTYECPRTHTLNNWSLRHCITQVNINLFSLWLLHPVMHLLTLLSFRFTLTREQVALSKPTHSTHRKENTTALRGQWKRTHIPQNITQTCITVVRLLWRTDSFSDSGVSEFKERERPGLHTSAISTG